MVALVLGAFAMGCSPILVRLADVGPFSSAFWRVALALPPLYLWQIMEDRTLGKKPLRRYDLWLLLLAGLSFSGDLIFWHVSILSTTVANATLLATTAPVWVFCFGFLFLKRKQRRAEVIGLVICLLGGMLLVRDSVEIDQKRLWGDAAALATSVFFGLYMVIVGIARRGLGAGRILYNSSLVTTFCLLLAAALSGETILPKAGDGWVILIALAWISQAAGQGLLSYALGHLPVAFSSLVIFLEAIGAAALGWLILHEPLGFWQWAGGALVLWGVWLARPIMNRTDEETRRG